ncbi:single-stranded DNA-binding protein [Escherichia coli]|uniref:single-stranded DNA-binding protein n=1 Tax=Escherichia coli TaxID=562 RepID=UPI001C6F5D6C|nr:single-stranded DNA-binding protein [Escherichia coli]MBW9035445.1 single-stranded DNA-binding protein [Escherichia coli]
MYIPQNFLPKSRQKLLRSSPGQSFPAVAVMPLAAKVLKKVMVNTGGNKRQVPAKPQNRGSRNSKDDGG